MKHRLSVTLALLLPAILLPGCGAGGSPAAPSVTAESLCGQWQLYIEETGRNAPAVKQPVTFTLLADGSYLCRLAESTPEETKGIWRLEGNKVTLTGARQPPVVYEYREDREPMLRHRAFDKEFFPRGVTMILRKDERGTRGLEPVRRKESEIAEYRQKWGMPENERNGELVALAEKHLVGVCGEKVSERQRCFRMPPDEDTVTVEFRTESGGKGEVTLRRSDAAIMKCVYAKSGGEPAKQSGSNPVEPVPEIAEKIRAGLMRANPAWECTEESFSLFRTELGLNIQISGAGISDLSSLEKFDFDTVWLVGTAVRGTGFLKNSKSLRAFAVVNDKRGFREVDLSGLRGKPLRNLGLANVRVADPACLAEIEFQILNLDHVENVDPAKFSRLRELGSFRAKDMTIGDIGFLRNSPKLRFVCLENVKSGNSPAK